MWYRDSMERDTIEQAYRAGLALSHLTGADSLTVFNPYDGDKEPELYDAWDKGFNHDGDIRSEDLRRDTPYNTYTRAGLPPTPIALPGAASIRAAAQPTRSGAIFFVATGESDGSHHFSATLAEHEAAVQRYLRKYRELNRNR